MSLGTLEYGSQWSFDEQTYPPDVEPQVMMAKAMPKPNAKPTWSRLPNAAFSAPRVKEAVAAIPGYT
jgi:hypothetical protein